MAFKQIQPQWLIDDTTGALGFKNPITGVDTAATALSRNASGQIVGLVGDGGAVVAGIVGGSRGSFLIQQAVTAGAVTGNSNWRTLMSVPEHYDAVRVGVLNIDPTTASTGVRVAVAASDSAIVGAANPSTNQVRDDTRWRNVTFGGSTTCNLVQSAFPAGLQYRPPTITWSDDIALSSIPRLDVPGAEPLFMMSMFLPSGTVGGLGYVNAMTSMSATYESKNGRVLRCYSQSGSDRTSIPGNWTGSTGEGLSNAGIMPIVQFLWRNKVVGIASYGDSTFAGFKATDTVGYISQAVNKAGQKTIHFNGGTSGDTSAVYFGRFVNTIRTVAPNIVIWQLSTINDGTLTQAIVDSQKLLAMQVIDYCKSQGIRVVLVSPLPGSTTAPSAGVQAFYLDLLAFTNNFGAGTGVIPCDVSAMHLVPGQWIAAYNAAADGYHPNDAGTAVLLPIVSTAISKAMALI